MCLAKYPAKFAGKYRQRCLQLCRGLHEHACLHPNLRLYLNLNLCLYLNLNLNLNFLLFLNSFQ